MTERKTTIIQALQSRGIDLTTHGVVWTVLSSGHMASFDRKKCTKPINGPEALSGKLCPEGWTLYKFPHCGIERMLAALAQAVIYYAGHAIEIGGTNYLSPVDARLATDRDVQFEAVALDQALAAVEGAKKLRLIILDACRNNLVARRLQVEV